jgi:hypothetical protein
MKTEMQATKQWVDSFSAIPGSLIERAYKGEGMEDLQLLAGGDLVSDCCDAELKSETVLSPAWRAGAPDTVEHFCSKCNLDCDVHWTGAQYAWPAGWGTLWIPCDMDLSWFKEHSDDVAKLGFIVYESDECGILLGIDGGGYDFFEAHWLPLYRLRGLKWHDEKAA